MSNQSLQNALQGAIPADSFIPNAPLVSVVAQIQFSPIAKIQQLEGIAQFQDKIRQEYPEMTPQEIVGVNFNISPAGGSARQEKMVFWQFSDDEKKWNVSLGQGSLSLLTTAYSRRSDFLDRIKKLLADFAQEFKPSPTKRIGLRYVNQIRGAAYANLKNYVNPDLLGILANDGEDIHHLLTETSLTAKEGNVTARWGKLPKGGTIEPELLPPIGEPSWIMDVDMYTEQKIAFNEETISPIFQALIQRQYAIFSWMTTPELRKRMPE